MKKFLSILLCAVLLAALLPGCSGSTEKAQIAATTLPVYQFADRLCAGTPLTVTRLISEPVSCLHDYTLQTGQMRAIAQARVVLLSGAGLEDFMEDALDGAHSVVDASAGIPLLPGEEGGDPHIWLSPENAKVMAQNIFAGLKEEFPEYGEKMEENLAALLADLDALQAYGQAKLENLSCRELIPFHDGFSYFAQAFDLTILAAVEEESGSEASASDLTSLIGLVREHSLPAIFTETNGSTAAAGTIAAETGVKVCALDMAMAGDDYFEAMRRNIDTVWEALR